MSFRSQKEKHELSHLYEAKIKNMGNAGRNGSEYYTPRPLIRAIVRVVNPQIGDKIYDGAVGSAGFLCESFDCLNSKLGLTTKDAKTSVSASKLSGVVLARVSVPSRVDNGSARGGLVSDGVQHVGSRGGCWNCTAPEA